MKLTKRLILANAATVIVPLMITVLVALAYIYLYGKLLGTDLSFESYQKLSEIRFELTGNQQSPLHRTPEIIEEESFHLHLQEQLSGIQGEVIILKNEKILFTSRNFNKVDIAKSIEIGNKTWGKEYLVIGNIPYTVELFSLQLKDGSQGKVILLAPLDQASKNVRTFFTLLGLTFLLSFALTNIYVSRQFSRTMVRPLRNLQKAAAEITLGNLSHTIAEEGDQEIRELCRDLERMRIKLKESIHTQLKYEDNRKMLVSSISHDLKTPITTIKGYIEGILDGITTTPQKTERYLRTISLKAEQVDQMIDDLLLYSKLDLKQIPFNFEGTDLEDYLRDFIAESEPELEHQGIQIIFESRLSKRQQINLDREKVKRVIMNILDNSLKYMQKSSGEINVILRETNTSIIIEFHDNGSGISPQDLPQIFDRFYRSDTSRSEIKGSGLGLAIAKQIIEGHGGRIWAVSPEAEGTSIIISLAKP
jgi:signal transduction histidine kinase